MSDTFPQSFVAPKTSQDGGEDAEVALPAVEAVPGATFSPRESVLHPKQMAALERVRVWMPSKMKALERAYRGECSPRAAIRAKCAECFGFDSGLEAEIRGCTSPACPLFAFRPGAKHA
jgi:hypothetical protein